MKKSIIKKAVIGLMYILISMPAHANDIVTDKSIGMELARDLANETVIACRKAGYHISVVVVDRFGLMRAALRDDLASRWKLLSAKPI